MPIYSYTANDSNSRKVKGNIEAESAEQASKILGQNSLVPISIQSKGGSLNPLGFISQIKGVSENDVTNFTRQLAAMINAGLPLVESLNILRTQTKSKYFAGKIAAVMKDVEGGSSFANALSKHSGTFSEVYISLIRAGEAGGVLDKILLRLADTMEKQRDFHSKTRGALIYPAILLVVMGIVISIMMIFVIPKLTALYTEVKVELPLPTRILIGMSGFMVKFWWLLGLSIITFLFVWKKVSKNQPVKGFVDRLSLKIPIFGPLSRQVMMTEFTRTLSLLVAAGVPILEALRVVRGIVDNGIYQKTIDDMMDKVERGSQLHQIIDASPLYPPIVGQMTRVGEETGKLDEVLGKLSNYFESEAEQTVKNLTVALEPFILLILGGAVAFLVLSIILPIYNLTNTFS